MIGYILVIIASGLSVRIGSITPIIDGREDPKWKRIPSVKVQWEVDPHFGNKITFPVYVKVGYDTNNLYVLFKIIYKGIAPTRTTVGEEDNVRVLLDPLNSGVNAYYFELNLSGDRSDALITNGGTSWDWEWEGVWEGATGLYEDKDTFAIYEFKIPFTTLKYSPKDTVWKANFSLYIASTKTTASWILPSSSTMLNIKDFGIIIGIHAPTKRTSILEFYPTMVYKYLNSIYLTDTIKKFHPSLDVQYHSNLLSLDFTFYPDFVEVEADPYGLNLTTPSVYYRESRLFFNEEMDVFNPLQAITSSVEFYPFYTRKVGVRIDPFSDVWIPILIGGKAIFKTKTTSAALLSVLTGEFDTVSQRLWNVGRIKFSLTDRFTFGMLGENRLTSGKEDYHAYQIDGLYTAKSFRSSYRIAITPNKGLYGEFSYGYWIENKHASTLLGMVATYSNKELNVQPMGYMNFLPGHQEILIAVSRFQRLSGVFRSFNINIIAHAERPSDTLKFLPGLYIQTGESFMKDKLFSFLNLTGSIGKSYNPLTGESYNGYFFNGGLFSRYASIVHGSIGIALGKTYLYAFNTVGKLRSLNGGITVSLLNQFYLAAYRGIERIYTVDNQFLGDYNTTTLRAGYSPTATLSLSLLSRFVEISNTILNTTGLTLSYELAPKSHLYFTASLNRRKENNNWSITEKRIGVKVQYRLGV